MDVLLLKGVNELIGECKTQRVLGGGLLPLNNNASVLEIEQITTVTVVDEDGQTPVAFGAFNRYSANQAYCMLNEIVDKYRKNFVKVEKMDSNKRNVVFKITQVLEERTSLGGLPQYFAAFAERSAQPLLQHVVDQLLAHTVGTKNMDVKKNITADLYSQDNKEYNTYDDALWRDHSGFVVTDRFRYYEIDIPKKTLLSIASKQASSGVNLRFDNLNKKSESFFGDYDSSIAIVHRQDFLDFFMGLHGVQGTIAFDEGSEPVGYVLSYNDRILQCYAETPSIGSELLARHVESMKFKNVKMFAKFDSEWMTQELLDAASSVRRVRRFHTRTMPAQVKWSKVFAVNAGLHLF